MKDTTKEDAREILRIAKLSGRKVSMDFARDLALFAKFATGVPKSESIFRKEELRPSLK